MVHETTEITKLIWSLPQVDADLELLDDHDSERNLSQRVLLLREDVESTFRGILAEHGMHQVHEGRNEASATVLVT